MSRRATAVVLGMFALVLALSSCGLPTSGSVRTVDAVGMGDAAGAFDYEPRGPLPGDKPEAIISGFLNSLLQSPLTFSVARQYLTEEARTKWQPSRRTYVYENGTLVQEVRTNFAQLTVGPAVELDSRGAWLGDLSGGAGQTFQLRLEQEGEEWRISELPDALIVPRSHFDNRFERFYLYFVDPTGKTLVPEPVYLPSGVQTATLLVAGLLEGPAPDLRSVQRSYIPQDTTLDLSVLVADGVAEVALDDTILGVRGTQLELMLAQLGWTLRQVPGVNEMKVTVDGAPAPGAAGSTRSVQGWDSLDPAGPSDPTLFAVQGDRVVTVSGSDINEYSAAFAGIALRSIGVSPTAAGRIAAVTAKGDEVWVTEGGAAATIAYRGEDLLPPVYDRAGVLWVVDRTDEGARVITIADGRPREMFVPRVTGRRVTAFRLSWDGSRFASISDSVVVASRVSRSEAGLPAGLSTGIRLAFDSIADDQPVDLAWIAPARLGVLVQFGVNSAQVLPANVDGSDFNPGAAYQSLFETMTSLISTASSTALVLLRAATGATYQAGQNGNWSRTPVPQDLIGLTYPG